MIKKFSYSIFAVFLLILTNQSFATHLIGGDMYFEHEGSSSYSFYLNVYRDCSSNNTNGTPLDNSSMLVVYDRITNAAIDTIVAPIFDQYDVDYASENPCVELPDDLCIEKGIYKFDVNLPANPNGYIISYQRCCYSPGIGNIQNGGSSGINVSVEISSDYLNSEIGSPVFNEDPPLTFCNLLNENYDFGANLPDSNLPIRYYVQTPVSGASAGGGMGGPTSNFPPPFTDLLFEPGYSETNIWDASVPLEYDSLSGSFSGVASELGYFLMKNDVAIKNPTTNEIMCIINRTFRYLVSDCNTSSAGIGLPPGVVGNVICGTKDVQFTSESDGVNTFIWDFGDSTSTTNKSNLENPTHSYTDFGNYTVTLIAYKDTIVCADTLELHIAVVDEVNSEITIDDSKQCLLQNKFTFEAFPEIDSNYSLFWNFGPKADITTSTDKSVSVSFSDTGFFQVNLVTQYFQCQTLESVTVHVREIDLSAIVPTDTNVCVGQKFDLIPQRTSPDFEYTWNILGADFKQESIEDFSFATTGDYWIYFEVIDVSLKCKSVDSILIHVYSFEMEDLEIEYHQTLLEDFAFSSNAPNSDSLKYKWFIDGEQVSDEYEFDTQLNPGQHNICLLIENLGKCTIERCRDVYVHYASDVFVPNVFSPNGDNKNEAFFPTGKIIDEAESYLMRIYDRWGRLLFESTNPKIQWKGLDLNGEELPQNTYIWTIRAQSPTEIYDKQGTVYLTK
jgi:gliding motility-associated-like protein